MLGSRSNNDSDFSEIATATHLTILRPNFASIFQTFQRLLGQSFVSLRTGFVWLVFRKARGRATPEPPRRFAKLCTEPDTAPGCSWLEPDTLLLVLRTFKCTMLCPLAVCNRTC